jgi:uncharacterized membrane protein YfcA
MNYLLVDLLGIVLIVTGLVMAFKKPRPRSGASTPKGDAEENPKVYVRRIAGFMLAGFGLALSVMFTTFHFA